MPENFENGEERDKRLPVHTKTTQFLPAGFENGRISQRNSNRDILKMASGEC